MPKTDEKKDEGVTYYFMPGGSYYESPKVDAEGLFKILENKSIEEGLTKQQRILFQHDVRVSVMDLRSKEVDEDMTSALQDMVSADDVDLPQYLQRAWRDVAEWGPSLVNPVWDYEGSEFRLLKLKRLPPESFANSGRNVSYVYNQILPGICLNDLTQEPEFWQTDNHGRITQLHNVMMLTDPVRRGLGGTPSIIPIYPYIKMMTYSWMRQMQKVNQYGSGGIWFLKVTDPTPDDKRYAKEIMTNVSSINRYQLRPNFTIENLGISESGSALETITQLGMEIRQFFTPSGLIQQDGGTLIGGSSGPEFDLYMSFTVAHHRYLEAFTRKLLRPWLVYNGYYDKGYRIVVDMPQPTVDRSEVYLKIHDSGSREGTLLPNEKRALLRAALPETAGIDISDLDDFGLLELEEYNESGQPPMTQLQKIEAVSRAVSANPLDPTFLIGSKTRARRFVQSLLGIENGEDDSGI
jgi:hypothetical protein